MRIILEYSLERCNQTRRAWPLNIKVFSGGGQIWSVHVTVVSHKIRTLWGILLLATSNALSPSSSFLFLSHLRSPLSFSGVVVVVAGRQAEVVDMSNQALLENKRVGGGERQVVTGGGQRNTRKRALESSFSSKYSRIDRQVQTKPLRNASTTF